VGHIRIGNHRNRNRQPRNPERAAQRKGRPHLPEGDDEKRQIHYGKERRERQAGRLREQHRHAGHAAVDEPAREQEPLDTE
jgi:hypothetical protein